MGTLKQIKSVFISTTLAGMLLSGVSYADIYTALTDYDAGNYAEAKREFDRLLPLGNDKAAFNLGVMYFNGDGVERDVALAHSYLQLSAELGNSEAAEILPQVEPHLTDEESQRLSYLYDNLEKQVQVPQGSLVSLSEASKTLQRAVVSRATPRYPRQAVDRSQSGFVVAQLLIDADGQVKSTRILDEYPSDTFGREASRSFMQWEYEPGDGLSIAMVRVDFGVQDSFSPPLVGEFVRNYGLWQGAHEESAEHQYVLSMFLQLFNTQSAAHLVFNDDLITTGEEDIDFERLSGVSGLSFRHSGFEGYARVELNQRGEILYVTSADKVAEQWSDQLVGERIRGRGIVAGEYSLHKAPGLSSRSQISVRQVVEVPRTYSADYWRDRAARNGSIEAQRRLTHFNQAWERYLLNQGDAEVIAWAGTRLFIEGQQEEGLALLQQSLELDYEMASEMISTLQALP